MHVKEGRWTVAYPPHTAIPIDVEAPVTSTGLGCRAAPAVHGRRARVGNCSQPLFHAMSSVVRARTDIHTRHGAEPSAPIFLFTCGEIAVIALRDRSHTHGGGTRSIGWTL